METAIQEAPPVPSPAAENLPAEARAVAGEWRRHARHERVRIKLTLDHAGHCYERLCGVLANPGRQVRTPLRPDAMISDPARLLDILDKGLRRMPQTTPVRVGKRGAVRLLAQVVALEVLPNEAAYLLRIVKNIKRDQWRETAQEHARFTPLEAVEIAEEEGGRGVFFPPSHPENPEASTRQAVIQKALGELPKRLGMSSEDVAALLAAVAEAQGNVSAAARQLGQPQRKTARRVERIQKHLQRRGLAA